jgi:hypothetical protein
VATQVSAVVQQGIYQMFVTHNQTWRIHNRSSHSLSLALGFNRFWTSHLPSSSGRLFHFGWVTTAYSVYHAATFDWSQTNINYLTVWHSTTVYIKKYSSPSAASFDFIHCAMKTQFCCVFLPCYAPKAYVEKYVILCKNFLNMVRKNLKM